MRDWFKVHWTAYWRWIAGALVLVAIVGGWWLFSGPPAQTAKQARQGRAPSQATKIEVELTDKQASTIQVGAVSRANFELLRSAVGNIDFNQDRLVQVFTPNPGRIIAAHANVGDRVLRGQLLFTIDSPDLLQAESTLISAAGVAVLQARNLKRITENLRGGGGAQKDVDQAVSDQQTSEGALRTARDAMRIFGKTDEEIDRIIADRKSDSALVVRSPIAGLVTQRTAAPGLFVQPGNAPAPFTIADTSTMWMVANVPDEQSAALRVGQTEKVSVSTYPDRIFEGAISVIGGSIDMQTRRVMVRSEIKDPEGLLRAGMFARFSIKVGDSLDSPAVPDSAVVREGDGSRTVWVASDRRHFEKRIVKIGLQQRGLTQIVEGLQAGDSIATDGAVFLSNKLEGGATD
jgi:cobalt-zinc-cadmium efflux system membrane fusion protein